jgi:high-affinity nickel-transport protein
LSGFDTASSIGLLAITAIAKRDADGKAIPSGYVVILPVRRPLSTARPELTPSIKFLFTAGMTLIDSLDSILMLYSYSGFPEHGWSVFVHEGESKVGKQPLNVERNEGTLPITRTESLPAPVTTNVHADLNADDITVTVKSLQSNDDERRPVLEPAPAAETKTGDERILRVKQNVMSGLSIVLTLMSIFVAFA